MANRKQRRAAKKGGIMGASHIPYAQRLAMQQRERIAVNRNRSAKIAMFCKCLAIHRVKGAGYKKLVEFSLRYKEVEEEIYEDLEYGMDKAKRRMEQLGMPISGELYSVKMPGFSKREQQVHDHAMQAAQVAMIAGAIAMNDVFGYGKTVQERIELETTKVTEEYNKNGFEWLLGQMEKLGFLVVDSEVRAFLDDDNKAVTPKRAKREGYPDAK
jgi:hypothetical protein